ncbi:flagellar export chaperone FliS [Paenibacillus harenae]|uniref:flagellar export chaperone FliS n=1 Tax=Paenibacillus harenae TaxID=306543 RepID=UPI00048E4A2E|nr:flagellar export chaperone FliS [Paenibacillus harenae]
MLHAQNQYQNTKVQTSSPGELTLLLYNGAIRFIKLGIAAIEQKDMNSKHMNFIKAQNIVDELQATLDMNYEISRNLVSLYDYIQSKLFEANAKKDKAAANESLNLITELRDTWAEALKLAKQDKVASNT